MTALQEHHYQDFRLKRMRYNADTFRIEDAGRIAKPALIVGIVGFAGSIAGLMGSSERFYFSYLTAYLFWLGLGLGGLFITMLHHLTGSVWSVVFRRIAEALSSTLPLMALLFVPVALGIHNLYEWSHPEALSDPILAKKAGFLNPTFFIIRAVIYLGGWSFLAWKLRSLSLQQDENPHVDFKPRFVKVSAPGMIFFALSISFAAFDWMMSLFPHWYSTIYGVYFAMGSIMASMALIIVVTVRLQAMGILKETISAEHRHDLGKLVFAFMILWAYMAFSQYFLIWYANLPEETIYYHQRWIGSWKTVALMIVFGHFTIPFLLLISRPAKRHPAFLAVMAVWMMAIHYIDLYWNVMPVNAPEGAAVHHTDLTMLIALGGLFMFWFLRTLSSHPLVPVGDPKLSASIHIVSR
jgi:hypothetical protein